MLMCAGKSDDSVMQHLKKEELLDPAPMQKDSLVEKNNELTQKWLKTNEKRDKLRLLEMAANAEEENKYKGE